MKIGIELEFWSPTKNRAALAKALSSKVRTIKTYVGRECGVPTMWNVTDDGSLIGCPTGCRTGVELVSPPLDTDNPVDMRNLRKVCKALQTIGCRVDHHCGLHVHVDAERLSVQDIKNIFSRYTAWEPSIDLMMPGNRRGEPYYAQSGKRFLDAVQNVQTRDAFFLAVSERYLRVNLRAIERHGTIEFRQHSGSLNGETIQRWISFLSQFVEASKADVMSKDLNKVIPAKKPRGRKPSNAGISSGCYKVLTALRNASGYQLRMGSLMTETGLSNSSVKVYISQLKTKHGMIISNYSVRGRTNPLYVLVNPNDPPRLVAPTSTRQQRANSIPQRPVDNLWRGIDAETKSYYVERMLELNAFNS